MTKAEANTFTARLEGLRLWVEECQDAWRRAQLERALDHIELDFDYLEGLQGDDTAEEEDA